jgi:glucosylceramidase
MKHFAHFVRPGARRRGLEGPLTGNAVAFESRDGSIIAVVNNPFNEKRRATIRCGELCTTVELAGMSVNTLVWR